MPSDCHGVTKQNNPNLSFLVYLHLTTIISYDILGNDYRMTMSSLFYLLDIGLREGAP